MTNYCELLLKSAEVRKQWSLCLRHPHALPIHITMLRPLFEPPMLPPPVKAAHSLRFSFPSVLLIYKLQSRLEMEANIILSMRC